MGLRRLFLFALLLLAGAGAVYAEINSGANPSQPFLNITATNQIDGVKINPNTAATGNFTTLTATTLNLTSGITTQNVPFSTVPSGNPLLLVTVQDIAVASVNQTGGYSFISGVTGRKIFPSGLSVMASGSGATSTGIKILCTGGNVLASIAVGNLVNNTPIPFGSGALNPGVAYSQGCASGDSVYVSNIGSNLGTTTDIYINMPYTVQ